MAGLTQTYRVTGDSVILRDMETGVMTDIILKDPQEDVVSVFEMSGLTNFVSIE